MRQMKNNKKIISLLLSLSLVFLISAPLFSPIISYAAAETIYIESAEDLMELSHKCSYDAWSVGKTVVLTKDISLEGLDFKPIPSFSGTFDGDGHTISGLNVSGAYCPAGFISTLEEEGEVKNLTISGVVSPQGDKGCVGGIVGDNYGKITDSRFIGTVVGSSDVGGIAGINELSGSISDCSASGEIVGENRVGGIAGTNNGIISSAKNEAKVNTVAVNSSLTLDEINLSLTLDITKLPSFKSGSVNDIGGVAGYSTGIILGCSNEGRVGYPHVGYNVGGIAGRSNGHISSCQNLAEVLGRKDVGGIAGQMEPHISYTLSEDLLAELKAELDEMSSVIDGAASSTGGGIPTISARLDSILESLDGASDSLNILINNGTEYGDQFIGEINRLGEILDEVISQLSGITSDVPTLSTLIGNSFEKLESALGSLEEISAIGQDALIDLKDASDDASAAFGNISDSITAIEAGLSSLQNSLEIKDKAQAEAALDTILGGLSELTEGFDSLTTALEDVNSVLGNAAWVDDGIGQLSELVKIFGDVTDSIAEIYDATTVIKENLDINWNKFTEAGSSLSDAVGHFAEAARGLADAMALMDRGLSKISDGLDKLSYAVSIKDAAAVEGAMQEIGAGFEELIAASAKVSEALADISDIIAELEAGGNLSDLFGDAADAIGRLATAGGESSSALIKLWGGVSTLIDNLEIDYDMISEGGGLIVGGLDDVTESLGKISTAADALADGMTSLDNAIKAIEEAVSIKDEAALQSALDEAYTSLGKIIDSMQQLAAVLKEVTDTLEEAKLWGDELISAMGGVTKGLSEMSDGLITLRDGVDLLRQNISFDPDEAEAGLDHIRLGLVKMADAALNIEELFGHLSDALDTIYEAGDTLPSAIDDLEGAVGYLANAMALLSSMSEKIDALVGYLDGVDPIQLPTPSAAITEEANKLFIYISAIENELKALNSDITSLSSDLVERVGRLNVIMTKISETIVDTIYGIDDGELIDTSVAESEIETVTNGRIFSCQNMGNIEGDRNVGGIAGVIGLEYTLDPEDDGEDELTLTQKKQYQLKAVIHASINSGAVTAKYDCVGGIAGKMDMGLIYGAESYGSIESLKGDYVGGIAGISAGLISSSFAKCSLGGDKYVGGVVGSGVKESYSGDSSTVRNCYTMVEITRFTQYGGAIAGINTGNFLENLFVSNSLAGIDRISYSGKAEPISYEDLVKRRIIPDGFYSMTLRFVADGVVIHSAEFEYGASFDQSVFPEIPEKEGHFSRWDRTELNCLTFDTTVNAVYYPYVSSIVSEEEREGGRNVFFVIGQFTDTDSLTVEKGCDTSGLVPEENLITKGELVESWRITIPSDGLDTNNIHFLPEGENAVIYLKTDGIWTKVDAKEFGSYLTFDAKGDVVEIAVVEESLNISIELIICVALILVQTVIIICIVAKVRRDKKKAQVGEKATAKK